jgi:hypothetical protein
MQGRKTAKGSKNRIENDHIITCGSTISNGTSTIKTKHIFEQLVAAPSVMAHQQSKPNTFSNNLWQQPEEAPKSLSLSLYKCARCGSNYRGVKRAPLLDCSRCKSVAYCSKECQVVHWKEMGHKKECSKLKAKHDEVSMT